MGKAMEREVNNTPIGFLYEKSAVDGNPLLRVLKPASLKGMNASDRAPRGLFSIPDLPTQHFSKVEEAYNLWVQCWATSYVPVILERQKWHEEDPNLSVNDIVYFKIVESPMKAEWKIGKVESVRLGRDDKVREVNVSHKIIKEGLSNWTHSVVTRPVREIIKLFEIKDTTFAEEMKAAHKAAELILKKRGEKINYIDERPVAVNSVGEKKETDDNDDHSKVDDEEYLSGTQENLQEQAVNDDIPANKFDASLHKPFLSCLSADEWLKLGAADVSQGEVQGCGGVHDVPEVEVGEMLFLL